MKLKKAERILKGRQDDYARMVSTDPNNGRGFKKPGAMASRGGRY